VFAKIFSQIYDSSIVENVELRFTFMDMLVLSDCNGVVDMTHEAIARRTNRPVELIRQTIITLEQPDDKSRTPDFRGARIKRLDDHRDWGWVILNYERFRQIASEEQRRQKTLARVHKHRGKTKRNAMKRSVTNGNDSPSASASASASEKELAKVKPTQAEMEEFCVTLGLPTSDGETMFHKWQGNGWSNGGKPIKDWKATIRSWKGEGYLPSQKGNNGAHKQITAKGSSRTYGTANERRIGQYDKVGKLPGI
jgi:hypothetical protein